MPITAPLPMPWAGKWADAVPDPDADLLRRYAAERDSAAFAVLVRRHGPLVFGVCLRAAGHRSDAEDAFQAVFLILAQKVGQLTRPELLGNWLYGVAYRVARKARRTAHRRRIREAVMVDVPHPTGSPPAAWSDLSPVLDDELARLAEHYRSAVLLCDVQGLSRTDAATRLGIPEGTLSSRLNAGRKKLADRLTKRGITLGAAGIGLFLADHATAAVPDALTGRLAELVARAANGEVIGGAVGELTREGITMRLKLWAGVAALGLGATGVAFAAWPGGDDKPKADPPKVAKADDPKAAEKEKGTATRKRARLLQTQELSKQVTGLNWMPTGKHLILPTDNEVRVLEITSKADATFIKEVASFALLPRRRFAGIAPDGSGPMTVSVSGGRVNAENAVQFWKLQAGKNSTAEVDVERSISLDVEPTRILGVTADGKHLLAELVKPMPASGEPNNPNPNVNDLESRSRLSHRFVRIDAQTGDVSGEVATFADPEALSVASAVAKAADRLFVQLHTRNETVYRAIDTATGKTVWEKSFEKTPFLRDNGQLIASADGASLFVRQSEFLAPPPVPQRGGGARGGIGGQGGPAGFGGGGMAVGGYNLTSVSNGWLINGRPASMQIPMVLDAKTGDRKKTVETGDLPFVYLEAISPDGKLAVGTVSAPNPPAEGGGGPWAGAANMFGGGGGNSVGMAVQRLVVWNTATGKAVKEWDLGGQRGSIFTAFAPDRPVLAIAEVQYTHVYSKDEKGNQTSEVKYTTVVGLWDVSGLSE
jgi:RNA polymerase sigma factor (sigma-70 family)